MGFSAVGVQGRAKLRTPQRSLDPLLAYLRQLSVLETRSSLRRVSATADSSGRYRPPDNLLTFLPALWLCRPSHRLSPGLSSHNAHQHDRLSA